MNSNDDKLGEQLRREAMAERPAYSRELHEQVMRGVRAERAMRNWRWPALAAAAAIVIAIGAVWMSQKHEKAAPVVQLATTQIQPQPLRLRTDLSVDIAGLVSARAWPPAIGVRVPGTRAGETASLQEKAATPVPSSRTQQAMARMLPTEVRALIFMSVNATE